MNGVLLPTTDFLGTTKTTGKHTTIQPDHENLIPILAQDLIKRRDTPHMSVYGTILDVCNNNNIRIGVCIMCVVYSPVADRKK